MVLVVLEVVTAVVMVFQKEQVAAMAVAMVLEVVTVGHDTH